MNRRRPGSGIHLLANDSPAILFSPHGRLAAVIGAACACESRIIGPPNAAAGKGHRIIRITKFSSNPVSSRSGQGG